MVALSLLLSANWIALGHGETTGKSQAATEAAFTPPYAVLEYVPASPC
jgi:hypothetical protein